MKDEEGEGCNIHGSLEVNKVAGNFHFATGKSFHHSSMNLLDLIALQTESYNVRICCISQYLSESELLTLVTLMLFLTCDADKSQN